MSARAVSKYTQKLIGGVGVVLLTFFHPDDHRIIMNHVRPRRRMVTCDVLRRGAATDLMDKVGDALAAPRSAYAPGERSI